MEKSGDLKDLDLTYAGRGVWLVKVPKYISECWKKAKAGDEVGKVSIAKSKGAAEVVFSVAGHLTSDTNPGTSEVTKIPTDHKFVMTGTSNQSLAILSTEPIPDGGNSSQHATVTECKVAIEGKVMQRAECRPIQDANYMKLKRLQLEAGNKPRKEVVQLSGVVNSYKPRSVHESQQDARQKKEIGKKTRLEKEQVLDLLYGAFEKHQYYNVKDLVRITNQPITFLKEILKEICVYNMKAPHKNMWELKGEYRHYRSTDSKE